jgi:Ca2+-binding RTX toxin-like protein
VLDRAPDATGLARWVGELDNGATKAEVVLGFSQSPQFKVETADGLKGWMRAQGEHDRIEAGAGNNTVAGGQFADVFVFKAGETSSTTVRDLEAWDYIELDGFGYNTSAEARAQMTQVGSDLMFASQGVEIAFLNTSLSEVTDDMILV